MNKEIVINPIGGLANRMRALAGCVNLAKAIGVDFEVIWSCNWEVAAMFEDVFVVPECLAHKIKYPGGMKYGLCYSIPRKKNFYLSALSHFRFGVSLFDSKKPLKEIVAGDDSDARLRSLVENVIAKRGRCFIQGGTDMYSYSSDEYRELFVLRPELCDRVAKVKDMLGQSAIGVHIRRTDNKESLTHSPDSLFMKEMERAIDEDANVKFYLASDDDNVKATFRRRFGDRIIASPYSARRDSKEGIINAAEEMFILAGTNRILGSYYSSFSEAAALLGGVNLLTVTDLP